MTMERKVLACAFLIVSHQPVRTIFGAPLHRNLQFRRPGWRSRGSAPRRSNAALILFPRGGDVSSENALANEVTTSDANTATAAQEQSLDERVYAAMRRLGLDDDGDPPRPGLGRSNDAAPLPAPLEGVGNCKREMFTSDPQTEIASITDDTAAASVEEGATPVPTTREEIHEVADAISSEMSVPRDIVLAAIYSSFSGTDDDRRINQKAARSIVQAEVDAIDGVTEDCPEVTQLVDEGFELFFVRRSLAFSGMEVANARAILMAEREDEEVERKAMEAATKGEPQVEDKAAKKEPPMRTVTVEYPKNFDPIAATDASTSTPRKPKGAPTPAKKEDVVFEGTAEDLHKLAIESPVPLLIDVYADWCGPCKQLTPALEQICINAGGMLRLVKINTDQQHHISGALEVKALPTVFGVRDGRILNSFQGLPRDEEMIGNFLMGLMVPGEGFKPPVSAEDKARYDHLSSKLLKLAAGASFSFSARERLQSHVGKLLDTLVETNGGETGMEVAEDSARVLRSLLSNIIGNPFKEKFRTVKLDNKVIAAKIAKFQPCLSILKTIGFAAEGDSALMVAKGKSVVNIAPFIVGRDCIDKWMEKNRYQIAVARRKRMDQAEHARLAAEAEEAVRNHAEEEEEEEGDKEEEDTSFCVIKLRLEGKKKVHDIRMNVDDTLAGLQGRLPIPVEDGETVQFTCAARRLIVKSTEADKMSLTLSQLGLAPTASLVVKVGERSSRDAFSKGSLAERAVSNKKKTKGSHSMHSIGLYAKDDGSKAETFESGGVLYDHDITDDEGEVGESSGDRNEEGDKNEEGDHYESEADKDDQ